MLCFTSLECVLVCWTLAFFVVRLRQPRPPLRHLVRQPGMVACGVWLLGMLLGICISTFEDHPHLGLVVVVLTACAIAVAWTILPLLGRWKRNLAGSTAWAEFWESAGPW